MSRFHIWIPYPNSDSMFSIIIYVLVILQYKIVLHFLN